MAFFAGRTNGEEIAADASMKNQSIEELHQSPVMRHLMESLNRGEDIGHYGRLVFVMVARHFLDEDQIVKFLRKDPDCDELKARGLVEQVSERDYNPPTRARILEWMEQQGFPICPEAGDPSACNVYRDLKFPEQVYQRISGFHEAKAEAQ
ncbi:MAG TPA: hypothetical protein VG345_04795 [Bryobacteraceae bacterium]|jgi:DNA primase large subunit|nr:hypothetical protein [Bryobacteraceae bacterium]